MSTQLKLDGRIGELFRNLLGSPRGTTIFSNAFDSSYEALRELAAYGCKVSAVCQNPSLSEALQDDNIFIVQHEHLELFKPQDTFHYGLALPPFDYVTETDGAEAGQAKVKFQTLADKMMLFECSKGKPDREAPAHIICLEAMLHACIISGYFAAILPRRWIGREMKYMRWWNENAAQVCRIVLPDNAVLQVPSKIPVPGFELCIWQKPVNPDNISQGGRQHYGRLKFMEFRYGPFIYKLPSLTTDDTSDCWKSFHKHDWWNNSVKLWNKMVIENEYDRWCGLSKHAPKHLDDPRNTWFFEPTAKNRPQLVQLDAEKIKELPLAVHIKPGPPVKLAAYNEVAQAHLLDLRDASGMRQLEGKNEFVFELDELCSREHFSILQEDLLNKLTIRGLTPCITPNDARKLRKQERWLNIQLTPMERMVPVKVTKGTAELDATEWEVMYEDIGVQSIFPEVLELWRQRARKMRMDMKGITFPFQFENLAYYCAKQSCELSDQMGLGKTRQLLLAALLRGCKHILLVVPKKLVGVWQEEIETLIIPYARRLGRNWLGEVIHADYQIIEWGKQCQKSELRTFNLISYDKLKAVPRDGKFFKCPKCEMVAFSKRGADTLICPGNPIQPEAERCNNIQKKWKQKCKDNGFRKYRVDLSTGKRTHWNSTGLTKIVDDRPAKPPMQMMEPQENMFKKMQHIQIGTERKYDEKTGERIEVPTYKLKQRDFHAAWTYSDLLRWTFNFIGAEEAVYVKNPDSKRTKAVQHLCGRHRYALTGTPIKGYPQSVLSILNWMLKRVVFPSYRLYDPLGKARFLRKYQTMVKIGASDSGEGGREKQIPKINNPELFQAEIAPFMRRNIRNQPNVICDIPKKEIEWERIEVDMDEEHRAYYRKWISKFSEWWQRMKEEVEGKKVGRGEIITKMGYLINASTIPHFMLDNVEARDKKAKAGRGRGVSTGNGDDDFASWAREIGRYKGPMTAKMKVCMELIKTAVSFNDKVLIASIRSKNLDLGNKWATDKAKLQSMVVDGRVSLDIKAGTNRSPRQEMIDNFRFYNYDTMWCGLTALAEGMNIPEANWGIIMDYSWDFLEWKQFIGRMLRPQQKKTIHTRFLIHRGAIDGYMAALSLLKEKSVDEALDYTTFDELSEDMIPDIQQYAQAIVDGTEEIAKQKMWLAVDRLRQLREEDTGDELGMEGLEDDDD